MKTLAFLLLAALPAGAAEPLAVHCGRLLDPAARVVRTDVTLGFADGEVVEPRPAGSRVVASGPAMSVTGGDPLHDGADDGVDWIEVYADRSGYHPAGGGWAAIPSFTLEEMKAIVDEAHNLRKRGTAHSMTPSGYRVALGAGVDSDEPGDLLDDEAVRAMVARKAPYGPTITTITVADFPPNVQDGSKKAGSSRS